MDVETENPSEIDSLPSKNFKTVFGPVSRQYFDLAILLLGVGLRGPLYNHHQEALFAAGNTSTIDASIKLFKQRSKSVIPRMG